MLSTEDGKIVPRQPIQDQSLWVRDDFNANNDWKMPIPLDVVTDIEAALTGLKQKALHPRDIRPEHFPLPNSKAFLKSVNQAIEVGPGFALLTGFPTQQLGAADASIAYQGFMSHFGNIAIQNRIGEYVVEVSDKGRGLGPQARGHYGNAELNFHADGGNAVSLLCLETAPQGGQSLLIGAASVYNAILRERPDILPILERGFYHHRRDEREEHDPKVTPWRTPVFAYYD
ncbi:MAG: TauD/TfdA family dioxygenase, partial [Alphaproteobacteria bacterium]